MKRLYVLSVICISFMGGAYAQEGSSLYAACSACHGQQAQGNVTMQAPRLAGQSKDYLKRQLTNFAQGLRGTHKDDPLGNNMVMFAKTLTQSESVEELTTYLANLDVARNDNVIEGDMKNGSRYYQGKCGACHGGQAQGNEAFKAPKLAGLSPDYIKRQMVNFKQGIRGTHKEDKYGRQMAMMSRNISDDVLHDIVFFITQQP